MKRFLLIIGLLLPMMAGAITVRDYISRQQIKTLISECRQYEGVEVVQLGQIGTGALKGAIRLASLSDSDARNIAKLTKGIKGISIFDFEGCPDHHKDIIRSRLERILANGEVLMEARDGGDQITIYGLVDEKGDKIRDFIMYAPADCALICLFGTISTDKVIHIIDND